MKNKQSVLILAMAFVLMVVGGSFAQDMRGVSVVQRPRPDFDALGIRTGAFTLFPKLDLGYEYNDNIYAIRTNETGDSIFTVAPEVRLQSGWSRHALGVATGAKGGFYASKSGENYIDAHIRMNGRVDVLRQSYFEGNAGFNRLHEDRGEPDVSTDYDEPVVYYRSQAQGSYRHGFGRLGVQVGGGILNLNYQSVDLRDGGSRDLDFRDRNIYNVNSRVSYELLPNVVPFVTLGHEWRRYDKDIEKRDSDGYRIGAGTGFDLGGITTGEVFFGYMNQDYKDRQDIDGFWYGLSLLANVTPITSLEARVERSIKETTLDNASGIEALSVSLRADHELLRNLLVGAFAHYLADDYTGVDVKDDFYTFGPRLTYLWNRNLSAALEYKHKIKASNDDRREYTENRFGVVLIGQF